MIKEGNRVWGRTGGDAEALARRFYPSCWNRHEPASLRAKRGRGIITASVLLAGTS
jgi:hypothetical protein